MNPITESPEIFLPVQPWIQKEKEESRKREREREYSRLSESTLEEIFGAFDEREIGVME